MVVHEESKRLASLWMFISAFSALFGAMSFGCAIGWTSSAFDSLQHKHINGLNLDPEIESDKVIKSWVSSCLTLGALCGCLSSGFIIRFLGKRKTLIMHNVPYLLGWATVCYAHNFTTMIVGRTFLGFSIGLTCGTASSYVADIVTPSTRGILGTFFQTIINLGLLYMSIFGLALDWNTLCYTALLPIGLCSVGMFLAPESPMELIAAGKVDEAKQALQKIRKPMSDIETELTELKDKVQTMKKDSQNQSTAALVVRADVYKPIIIALLLMFFQQFSGINAVMFYLSDIFNHKSSKASTGDMTTTTTEAPATGGVQKAQLESIGVNVALVVTTLLSGFIIDRLGRKVLLIISGAGHVVSLLVMGLYYFKADDWFENASWLPIVCLIMFVCFFSIGYGPIPWMIISELTPSDALGLVSSIGTAFNWLCAFIVTKEFEDIQKVVHDYGTYWIFGGISLVSVIYTTFMVPETKHRTIEDMRRYFQGQE